MLHRRQAHYVTLKHCGRDSLRIFIAVAFRRITVLRESAFMSKEVGSCLDKVSPVLAELGLRICRMCQGLTLALFSLSCGDVKGDLAMIS